MGDNTVRVRFAPSPTGALHIGGARTAYFNWLFAKQNHGVMVLRIDDTDKERSTESSYQQIISSLQWLGLDWDEGPDIGGEFGPYRQSQRQSIYEDELTQLIAEDKVYPCFCSQELLQADRVEAQRKGTTPRYVGRCKHLSKSEVDERLARGFTPVYRLRVPQEGETVVEDQIRGKVVFSNHEVDDFIVWKADGTPTYHFASCVDDAKLHITHIIRAEEHLSNTPRHVALFTALGYKIPQFAHVPMILAPDRSKLSKRHGATSVEDYKKAGILPQALINYLLLLGFSPGENQEIVSVNEAVQLFDIDRVAKHAAIYDEKKLEWMNTQYFRKLPIGEVVDHVWPLLKQYGWVSSDETRERLTWISALLSIMREKVRNEHELIDGIHYYFEDIETYDLKGVKKYFAKPELVDWFQLAVTRLKAVMPFLPANIEDMYRSLAAELGIKNGDLIHPTRLAISGLTAGPGLFDLMFLLGKEVCIHRIEVAIKKMVKGEFLQDS